MCLFHYLSGWSKLVERYPAVYLPADQTLKHQTVQVGPVRFRRCATVHVASEGLYLRPDVFFRSYPPVLIPWSEIVDVQTSHIYVWETAKKLSIGQPAGHTIIVTNSMFRLLEPYLHIEAEHGF
jgi:hypothetical protein